MIELNNVGMSYSGRTLFRDVSLLVPQGSFYFLTGPSGAGKTTLLRLCSMELAPSEGQVKLLEEDVSRLDRSGVAALRRRIGVVHQDSRFIDHLPLSENVMLPVTVSGIAGMATVSSQRRQPSLLVGSHRRLKTIARTRASASDSRREDRRARCSALSIPNSRQSSWSAKTSP